MSDQIQNINFVTEFSDVISSTSDLGNDNQPVNPQDVLNDAFNNPHQPVVEEKIEELAENLLPEVPFDVPSEVETDNNSNSNDLVVKTEELKKNEEESKPQNILKENMSIALNSFKALKDVTTNLMYRDGIAYFYTHIKNTVCEFNSNCPSLNFDFSNIASLGVIENLFKREDFQYKETDDGKAYIFTDGKYKYHIRKAVPPSDSKGNPVDIKNMYFKRRDPFYGEHKLENTLLASYEFTDKNDLSIFVDTMRSLKSFGDLNMYSNNNKLIIASGNLGVNGEFILLELPYNTQVYDKVIKTTLDPACLRLDYISLKFEFRFITNNGNDVIVLFSSGVLKSNNFILNCAQLTHAFK